MDTTKDVVAARPAARRAWPVRPLLLLLVLSIAAFLLPRDRGGPVVGEPGGEEAQPEPVPAATGPTLLPVSDFIYRVPARIRPSCRQVPVGDAPVEVLECHEDVTRATYLRYADPAQMDSVFDAIVVPMNLPQREGGCRAGIPARETWRYTHTRTQEEGRMACFFVGTDVPATVVTQPETRMLSIVISNPNIGWAGHFAKWQTMVPNPSPDEASPRPPAPGAPAPPASEGEPAPGTGAPAPADPAAPVPVGAPPEPPAP